MNNQINEQDVVQTLRDFDIFCAYLEENRPKLTKAREELGKKDCFNINSQLSTPREMEGPKYLMPSYPSITLFFSIALTTGFFEAEYGKGDYLYLVPTQKLDQYRTLTPLNRYMLLLKNYWTQLDFDELYYDTMSMFHHFMYTKLAFEVLGQAEPGVRIFANVENFNQDYEVHNPIHRFFVGAGSVIAHLSTLGLWDYEEANILQFHQSKKEVNVKAVTPTRLGIAMIQALRKRPYELYHENPDENMINQNWRDTSIIPMIQKLGLERSLPNSSLEPFEEVFREVFSENPDSQAINKVLGKDERVPSELTQGNVFVFKVSLNKKTWRKIVISASHTLEHLHQTILGAFEFSEDHLYAFFMDGKPWSKFAYWARGAEKEPLANQTLLKSLDLFPGQEFLYLYDFGDEWRFTVELIEVQDAKIIPLRGKVIEEKGKAPEQY